MFPQDSLRQRLLTRTEWATRVVNLTHATEDSSEGLLNEKLQELREQHFNVTGFQAVSGNLVITAQRVTSPVDDPTPQGVPHPSTQAIQDVQITYTCIEADGSPNQRLVTSLEDGVRQAISDKARGAEPLSIHVTSVTSYGSNDIARLRESFVR